MIALAPLLALGAVALPAPALAQDQAQDMRFGWCMASEPTYGRYHLVSTVFRLPAGVYHVGVQNSFLAFAEADDGRDFGFVSCSVTYEERQEAEDDRNQFIADRRRADHDVATARWRYHGD